MPSKQPARARSGSTGSRQHAAPKRAGRQPAAPVESSSTARPRVAFNRQIAVQPDMFSRRATIPFEGTNVVVGLRRVPPEHRGKAPPSIVYCVEVEGKLHPISDEAFLLRFMETNGAAYRRALLI